MDLHPFTVARRGIERAPATDVDDDPLTGSGAIAAIGHDDRRKTLARLYEEQRELRTAARLRKLTPHESDYLADVCREIDHYESFEPSLRDGELWRRVESLAVRILGDNGGG